MCIRSSTSSSTFITCQCVTTRNTTSQRVQGKHLCASDHESAPPPSCANASQREARQCQVLPLHYDQYWLRVAQNPTHQLPIDFRRWMHLLYTKGVCIPDAEVLLSSLLGYESVEMAPATPFQSTFVPLHLLSPHLTTRSFNGRLLLVQTCPFHVSLVVARTTNHLQVAVSVLVLAPIGFWRLCANQFPTSTHTTSLGSPQQFTFPLLPHPLLPPYPSKPIPRSNPPTQFIPPNHSCASTMPFFKVCTISPCCCWFRGWRVPEKTGRRDSAPRALITVFEAEVHPHNAHDTRCNQVELFCAGKVIPRFAWVPKSA